MKKSIIIISLIFFFILPSNRALGCTSMIVSAERSACGRPLLWKHRDTDADNNFLYKVMPTDSTFGYVALFNAGDSLLEQAWMGMNDKGFAIMNTASYNLPEHQSALCDREGYIMSEALKSCRTLADFESLLESLPKPLGVQANFGVIDGSGGAAYFETSDTKWEIFPVSESPDGYLIRTNHSISGTGDKGRGYIRYATAEKLASAHEGNFDAKDFTEFFSRQFYHSLFDRDFSTDSIVVDLDFIPRPISTASLVVIGITPEIPASEIEMWGCLGYPPCAKSDKITLEEIPEDFLPCGSQWRSAACDQAARLRQSILISPSPEGRNYINMNQLRQIIK